VSPWCELIELGVEFNKGAPREIYHSVGQPDYIAIVARTPDGMIPIVRQFRPAVGDFTWELPAGTIDAGETAEESCRRELLEETGFPSRTVHALGSYAPCTARLSNKVHSFFVETGPRDDQFPGEAGIEVRLVTQQELAALIRAGEFVLQLHIGALMLAGMDGYLELSSFR
jgi:8-oxo-dGTP pyrophosphatase MutT (NUDIX family)